MGTPKNLDELARDILMVPMNQFQERVPQMIREYILQGCGACATIDPEHAKVIEKCFQRLCRRSDQGDRP